jgi:hypothetical protein
MFSYPNVDIVCDFFYHLKSGMKLFTVVKYTSWFNIFNELMAFEFFFVRYNNVTPNGIHFLIYVLRKPTMFSLEPIFYLLCVGSSGNNEKNDQIFLHGGG